MVLKSFKAYETGNVDEAVEYFADTLHFIADNFDEKISKDSLRSILKSSHDQFKSIKIKMEDWESVISKDKKTQFVSLWYKQTTEDKNGKVDAIFMMDDVEIKN